MMFNHPTLAVLLLSLLLGGLLRPTLSSHTVGAASPATEMCLPETGLCVSREASLSVGEPTASWPAMATR